MTARLDQLPEVLKAAEAMDLLRLSKNAFYRAVAAGEIPVIRIGRSQRFSRVAITRLIDGLGEVDR